MKMNNKRGGAGGKFLLVLILMLIAAGGGAYGYRMLDGKMAVRDAQKVVKDVDVEDYDTEEAAQIQVHLNNVNKDLETAQTRKEVYEIVSEFKEEVAKIKTKSEKELEAAKREAEEARRANQNNYDSGNSGNSGNSGTDQPVDTQNTGGGTTNSDSGGGYKSNDLSDAEDGTEDSGGLFNFFGNDGDN